MYSWIQVAYEFTRFMDLDNSSYKPSNEAKLLLETDGLVHPDATEHRSVVVSSIVSFQGIVSKMCAKLAQRQARHNFISPRDYMDFIKHYVDFFSEKREQLEDQQRHLSVGLKKLVETGDQVSTMRGSLTVKKEQLEKKNRLANEKLKQMIKDQNTAEKQKEKSLKLSAALAIKDREIQERTLAAQAELDLAEPALLEAQESVGGISKKMLDEIRVLGKPPENAQRTLEMICVMLGMGKLTWAEIRKAIRKDTFIGSIISFDSENITRSIRRTVEGKYLSVKGFDLNTVQRASR